MGIYHTNEQEKVMLKPFATDVIAITPAAQAACQAACAAGGRAFND